MLAYLSAEGIRQYLHGVNAPIWHALVTPGNSLWLNAAAAVVAALALGYAFGRFVQSVRKERLPSVGWRVATAFFCVPPFVPHITGLSPLMVTLLPVSLSLAALMLPGAHRKVSIFKATSCWALGFIAVLVIEGLCLGFNVRIVKPFWPPLAGLGFFACIGIVPAIVVICLGFGT